MCDGSKLSPKPGPVADRVEGGHRRPVVVRDLARMHLVGEADTDLVEDVDDRVPAIGEVGVAGLDHVVAHRREHRHVVPDRRTGEADHRLDAERGGRPRGGLHLLGRPLAHALRVTVAPDPRVDHVLVPVVDDRLAHRLAVQVVGDRPATQTVLLQDVPLALRRTSRPRRPGRRRSGHPSRRSPGRRTPTRRPAGTPPRTGRSAHCPVNRVTGRACVWRRWLLGRSLLVIVAPSSSDRLDVAELACGWSIVARVPQDVAASGVLRTRVRMKSKSESRLRVDERERVDATELITGPLPSPASRP